MKTINILSYVLNVVLVLALIFVIKGANNGAPEDVLDGIKQSIVQQERAQLPLTTQRLTSVNEVRIDSLVIINNVEPYTGYLVTEWTYGPKKLKKTMYVEVSDIRYRNNKISWSSNWLGASLANLMD